MNKTMNTRTIRPDLDLDAYLEDSILPCTADLQNDDVDCDYDYDFDDYEQPNDDYDYDYEELPAISEPVFVPEPQALSAEELAEIRRFEEQQERLKRDAELERERVELDRIRKENEEKEQTLLEWVQSHPTTQIPAPMIKNGVAIPTASLSKRWKTYCEEYVEESRAIRAEQERLEREEVMAKAKVAIAESNARLAKLEKKRQAERTKMYKRDDVLAAETAKRNAKAHKESRKAQAQAQPIEKPVGRTLLIRPKPEPTEQERLAREKEVIAESNARLAKLEKKRQYKAQAKAPKPEQEPTVELIGEPTDLETTSLSEEEFPLLIGLENKNDLFKNEMPKKTKKVKAKAKEVEAQKSNRRTQPVTICTLIEQIEQTERLEKERLAKEEAKARAIVEAKKNESNDEETFARLMCAVQGQVTERASSDKPKPKPRPKPVVAPTPPPAPKPVQNIKTRLCHSVTKGGRCPHGAQCRFAHSIAELQFPVCHYGDKCYRKSSADYPCGFIHPNESVEAVCLRLGYSIAQPAKSQPVKTQPVKSQYTAPVAPWLKPKTRRSRWDVR